MKLEAFLPSGKLEFDMKTSLDAFGVTVLHDNYVLSIFGREVEDTYYLTLSESEMKSLLQAVAEVKKT